MDSKARPPIFGTETHLQLASFLDISSSMAGYKKSMCVVVIYTIISEITGKRILNKRYNQFRFMINTLYIVRAIKIN